MQKVKKVVRRLKKGKASFLDKVKIKIIKNGGD